MSDCFLVTGGSGFIGTWVLRELLERGARAVVVDSQKAPERWSRVLGHRVSEVISADATLTDCESLLSVIRKFQVSHLIHLAALLTPACQQDPFLGCQVNVLGSTAVFEAARRSEKIRALSYASSYAVYGPESGESDDHPNRPPSFYGAFKQAVDMIAQQFWRHYQIASVAIRPHVVFGPEREVGLTAGPSLACRAAAIQEDCIISYTGRVGYDYVEDVAKAFVRAALECPQGATVADLPGEIASTEDFRQAILECVPGAAQHIRISGPQIPANIPPNPNYISRLFLDWQTTSLKLGVQKTIDYYVSRNESVTDRR